MNKKRKVTKRIAAWFMCLAMVSTTVNLPAFVVKAEAADPTSDEIIYDVNINGPHHLKYDEASETYICQDEDCGDKFEPGYYNIWGECNQEAVAYILQGNMTTAEEINFSDRYEIEIVDYRNLKSADIVDFGDCYDLRIIDLRSLLYVNDAFISIQNYAFESIIIHEGNPADILLAVPEESISYVSHTLVVDSKNPNQHICSFCGASEKHSFSDDTCQGVCACGAKNVAGNHNFSDNGTCECGLTQLKYEVISSTDKTVRVTGLNDGVTAEGDLIIPKTVKVDGEDYLVIEIGYQAFKDCTGFTGKLVIPDSVTTIGRGAFDLCTGLTGELIIPDSVTTIDRGAFASCVGLTGELIIPDSITTIGAGAFEFCGFTGKVIIPDSVTTIDDRPFYKCANITSISIPCSVDPRISLGHVSGVVTQRDHDFSDDAYQGVCTVCWETTITYTVISDADKTVRVTGLNDSVYTSGNLIIPKTVKVDGEDYRVTEIGEKAFYMNSKITGNVVIPDSITAIGNYAFWGCTLANSIIMLSEEPPIFGMETVKGKDVYVPCLSYEKYVNVLSGVAGYVGLNHDFSTDPFVCSICGNSNEVSGNCGAEADGDNIKWAIVDDTTLLIQGSGAMEDFVVDNEWGIIDTPWNEYCLYNEASITNIQLSEGITHIGDYAFAKYTYDGIEYDEVSVIIPDSVESIGTNAFASNVNIQSVSIPCSLEYSDVWGIDEDKVTQRNHKFSGDCDTTCNVCGYERVATGNHDFSPETHKCICGADEPQYKAALYSSSNDGTSSVVQLSQSETCYAGDSNTVVAGKREGYTFLGWYPVTNVSGDVITYDVTPVSKDIAYTYTVTKDDNIQLVAVYEVNAAMTITIKTEGDPSDITIGGVAATEISTVKSYKVGENVTVVASGSDFAYWANDAGSVLGNSASYTFKVVGNTTVNAIYNKAEESKVTVNFVSGYNQIVQRSQYGADDVISIPEGPVKTDYTFVGWSVNGGATVTAETVETAIDSARTAALATPETSDDIITVQAMYQVEVTAVNVTVKNGESATGETTSCNKNDVVAVTADVVENKKFSHWADGTDKVLSYNETYTFYATKDVTVQAVYVAVETVVEAQGTTTMESTTVDNVNHKVSFVSMSSVPEDCTIDFAGVIATNVSGSFDETTATYVRGASDVSVHNVRYTWTKTNATSQTWYARAYLVYTDKNGNQHKVYGDIVSGTVN